MLYFSVYKFLCFILQFRERTELQRKDKEEESGLKIQRYFNPAHNVMYAATNVHLAETLVQGGDQFFGDHVDEFNARRF